MNANPASSQYSVANGATSSRANIEHALARAGLDPEKLTPADLTMVEDFHTMGRIATEQLANLVGLRPDHAVLDAGSGIGGTARYVASRFGCRVTAIDLTEDYCATSRWLNELAGLDEQITVRQGDVTRLPLADGAYDVVFSQHVQMNIPDKPLLYREARRVLVDGGVLAIWDVVSGSGPGAPDYPLPWADEPGLSHLVGSQELRRAIEEAGFAVEHWQDPTEDAAALMRAILEQPPNPVGLQAFVPDFAAKAENLTAGLADGRLRVVQILARAEPRT